MYCCFGSYHTSGVICFIYSRNITNKSLISMFFRVHKLTSECSIIAAKHSFIGFTYNHKLLLELIGFWSCVFYLNRTSIHQYIIFDKISIPLSPITTIRTANYFQKFVHLLPTIFIILSDSTYSLMDPIIKRFAFNISKLQSLH